MSYISRLAAFSGGLYLPESMALFRRMSSAPTAYQREGIDQTIGGLKTDHLWPKYDTLTVFDHTAAPRDWRRPARTFTQVGAPNVVANRGTKGDGAVAAGFNTFANPATLGGRYSLNSATIFCWSLTHNSATGSDIGTGTSCRLIGSTTGTMSARLNATGNISMTVPNSCGSLLATRNANGTAKIAFNQDISAEIASTATAVTSNNFTIGFASTSLSARRILMGGFGGGFSDDDILNHVRRWSDYAAWVGAEFEANIALAEPSGSPVWGQYRVYANGTVKLTTTMVGTKDVAAKITEADSGATVVDWTTVATGLATGTHEVELTGVPDGSDLKAELKFTDDSAATGRTLGNFAAGLNITIGGDSSGLRLMSTVSSPPAPLGDAHRFTGLPYSETLSRTGWPANHLPKQPNERGSTYGGDGIVHFQNLLHTLLDRPLGILPMSFVGTRLPQWLLGGDPVDGLGGANMADATVKALSDPGALGCPGLDQMGPWFFFDGVNSAAASVTKAGHKTNLTTLLAQIRTWTGDADLPLFINNVGASYAMTGTVVTDTDMNAVRHAQLEFWDENKTDSVYLVGNYFVLPQADDVGHPDVDGLLVLAAWMARAVCKHFGVATHGAEGPQIASATATGNTIRIAVTHAGGTSLKDITGSTSGTGLTGFKARVNAVERTITAAVLDAGEIVLTVGGAAFVAGVDVVEAVYQDGKGSSAAKANPVFDNDLVTGDALFPGLPLQPSRGWVTATVS